MNTGILDQHPCRELYALGRIVCEAGYVERVDLGPTGEWGSHATAQVLTNDFTSFRAKINDMHRGAKTCASMQTWTGMLALVLLVLSTMVSQRAPPPLDPR